MKKLCNKNLYNRYFVDLRGNEKNKILLKIDCDETQKDEILHSHIIENQNFLKIDIKLRLGYYEEIVFFVVDLNKFEFTQSNFLHLIVNINSKNG